MAPAALMSVEFPTSRYAAPYYFVFDVESVGLFGEAFAVGWVVVNARGEELADGYSGVSVHVVRGRPGD